MPRKKKPAAVPSDPPGIQPLGPLDPAYGSFQVQAVPPTDTLPTVPSKANRIQASTTSATKQATETAEASTTDGNNTPGDTPTAPIAPDVDVGTVPRAREMGEVISRLQREGRWRDLAAIRDAMVMEAKAGGMTLSQAREWTYAELDRLYPPLPPKEKPEPVAAQEVTPPPDDKIGGLYLVPEAWPPLTDNASLQAELGWVQSQRLSIIEEKGNAVTVHLERASCPAPSKAALGWLETSIRSYSKYVDVVAKVLAGQADEAEATRRERMRLDDIRSLLDEMHRAG